MWLHNTATLELRYFNSPDDVPEGYAILSHVWDKNGEQTFQEVQAIWTEYKLNELSHVRDGVLFPACVET